MHEDSPQKNTHRYDMSLEDSDENQLDVNQDKKTAAQRKKSSSLAKSIGMAALVGSSLNAAAANEAPKTGDNFPDPIETKHDVSENTYADAADPFGVVSDAERTTTSDPVKKTSETSSSPETELEHFSIDVTKSFSFEKATLNPEQFQEAELEVVRQLKSLDQAILQDLEVGKKVISVKVSRSPEHIVKGGYDAGRGWVFNNEELARDTAEEGGDLIDSALQKIGLPKLTIQFEIPEGGVDTTNPTRYVKISFEDVLETDSSPAAEIITSPELSRLSQSYAVIIDRSPSMNAEANDVQKTVNNMNKQLDLGIKIITLEAGTGGATEKHMLTFNRVLDRVKKPFQEKKYIYVYTDEPDFDSSKPYLADGKYEKKLQETIDRARSLNIELRIKAFEPGNTMKYVDKALESNDLTMQTEKSELDHAWFDQLQNKNSLAVQK